MGSLESSKGGLKSWRFSKDKESSKFAESVTVSTDSVVGFFSGHSVLEHSQCCECCVDNAARTKRERLLPLGTCHCPPFPILNLVGGVPMLTVTRP